MKKKRNTSKPKKFSVEDAILKIGQHLVRDFRNNLEQPDYCSTFLKVLHRKDIRAIRDCTPVADMDSDSYEFKCTYQLSSLLKRFRFKKDLYSDEELAEMALEKFEFTQHRISTIDWKNLGCFTETILDGAKIYIHQVLGEFCDDECRELSRFGRKASVGIPAHSACEAERWESPITGTLDQIAWFDSEMSANPLVKFYYDQRVAEGKLPLCYKAVDTLTLALVPKTFKSMRVILPNTTLGSYQSYGVGEMIRKRLRKAGYDIRTLQERHKYLARLASHNNMYVTADLSSASDSITRELLQRILPSDWFEFLDANRAGNVRLPDGRIIPSTTFCTMGIGYTFPLQTLVFLALLKSIQAYFYDRLDRRLISVYGDDMIYHRRMHDMVVYVFGKVGFVVNIEKSFHDGPFRESCGGDYHRGLDVRPFQPRNEQSRLVPKPRYEAFLYKCVNGLLRRWTESEIPETLEFLVQELNRCTTIKPVPLDYPDDSGIRVSLQTLPEFLKGIRMSKAKHKGNGVFGFSYLRFISNQRKEERHDPYYWLFLRGHTGHQFLGGQHMCSSTSFLQSLLDTTTGTENDVPSALGKRVEGEQRRRNCKTDAGERKYERCVVIHNTGSYKRQIGTSRFEVR